MSSSPEPTTTGKKAQPIPWTHEETVHLIEAYQQKWYSLNRGQLKSPQWEEVAVTVAARCGYDFSHPSKSALQCRHKMEKLRQRFHRLRLSHPLSSSSAAHSSPSWPYFDLMDRLLRGPFPLSACPLDYHDGDREHNSDNDDLADDDEENDNGDDDEENESCFTKSRSINYILRKPTIVNRFAVAKEKLGIGRKCADDGASRAFWEEPAVKRPRNDGGREAVLGLAREIRAFSERIVGVESMKMEMMKVTEKWRIEMESKRLEMILRSQHKIVDSIAKAFGSSSPNRLNVAKEEI